MNSYWMSHDYYYNIHRKSSQPHYVHQLCHENSYDSNEFTLDLLSVVHIRYSHHHAAMMGAKAAFTHA